MSVSKLGQGHQLNREGRAETKRGSNLDSIFFSVTGKNTDVVFGVFFFFFACLGFFMWGEN